MGIAPQYKHDCSDCNYLGQYKEYDLYICLSEPTLIARWSSKGPEYNSGVVFGIIGKEGHPLRECLIRALKVPEYRNVLNEHVLKYETSNMVAYGKILREVSV